MLATTDDVNANLDGDVVKADDSNIALIQISVERSVKAYLGRVISQPTLQSWATPDETPDIVREAAAKLIAAQLYYNKTSRTTTEVDANNFGQIRYNEGMELLNMIISGSITIPSVDYEPTESLSVLDFWPNDSTDRAFTLGKKLYGQNV